MVILLNDFKAQWEEVRNDALQALDRVGKSGWLILGSEVQRFEKSLPQHFGATHAVGCANGLDAIEIALRALGIKAGDKVLTTPLSAFATTLAILRAGGIPVFCDVDETGLLDLNAVEEILGSNPEIRYLLPVHLYGHSLDLKRLRHLKARFQLKLVEDCAQSIGASFEGELAGSVGQCAATSFYPTKNLGCMGDGGAFLTSDDGLASAARTLRDYGQSAKYIHSELGMNSRLDELQAAILSDALLPRLERWTARRKEIAARFSSGIRHAALTLPRAPRGSDSVWHLYPVRVRGNRAAFMDHLKAQGVSSGIHYPRLITDQEALTRLGKPYCFGNLDRAREFAETEISLPIHPYLTEAEIENVIRAANTWAVKGQGK